MKLTRLTMLFLGILAVGVGVSSAQTKRVNVKFPAGASEATYSNSFTGYGTVDFVFAAKANQQLTAELISSDGDKAILTVMRNGTVIQDDASMVPSWTGNLPANGSYMVRVGQMRNDARGSRTAVKFKIVIRILT